MALTTNLESWWELGEASGTRSDSHGSNHLTDNNTVTSGTGIVGDAAKFTRANAEWLSRVDNASLSTGDIDFCFAGWLNFDAINVDQWLLQKTDVSLEYRFSLNSTAHRLHWEVADANYADLTLSTFGAPAAANWYFLFLYHDSINNLIGGSVNDGAVDTAACTGGPADTADRFTMGGGFGGLMGDLRMDQWGFWKGRVITSLEVTELYNGGAGRAYSYVNPSGGTTGGAMAHHLRSMGAH